MPITNYLEDALAGWMFVGAAYTPPATFYVALHTGNPGESGTPANEVAGVNYTRMGLARGTGWAAVIAGSGLSASAASLIWPVAGDAWGSITHLSVCDAATAGNVLFYEAAVTTRTIGIGDVYRIGAGNLSAGFD